MRRHPVTAFLLLTIPATWAVQFTFLAAGWELFPALLIELFLLLGAAVAVTAATDGRPGVRRLFARAVQWRMGWGWFAVGVLALPALAVATAAVTGTLRGPADGWLTEIGGYLFLTLVFGALLGNMWEETAWAGFLQSRLMDRHGWVRGSLLTAAPFALIHLPLAFEADGLTGTSAPDLAVAWAALILAAPVFRLLLGLVQLGTGGSVLAVAVLHASFNATQKLSIVPGEWPTYVALVVLLALAVPLARRRAQARFAERGYASAGSVSTLTR